MTASPLQADKLAETKLTRFDPLTTSVWTEEGRALATDPYLNACRLLAHHSRQRILQIDGMPVDPNTIIYVCEPCGLFRGKILCHLESTAKSTSFMPTFHVVFWRPC
jgi:hypothetical protein